MTESIFFSFKGIFSVPHFFRKVYLKKKSYLARCSQTLTNRMSACGISRFSTVKMCVDFNYIPLFSSFAQDGFP